MALIDDALLTIVTDFIATVIPSKIPAAADIVKVASKNITHPEI